MDTLDKMELAVMDLLVQSQVVQLHMHVVAVVEMNKMCQAKADLAV
jgi:hypothetical protein